jgi:PadR family transcriptional regulator AphA
MSIDTCYRAQVRTPVLSRALLGLIAGEPMSGYALARLFERTLGRTWPTQHPQIYPALAALRAEGLLRVTEEGPRGRKTYAVTDDGLAEAQRWLRETAPDRTVRNEAMLRVFLLWLLEADEAIGYFDDELAEHRQRLDDFERTLADDERQRAEHGTAAGGIPFCASLALDWGLRYEREYIAWATWARDRIANGAQAWNDERERRLGQGTATASATATGT